MASLAGKISLQVQWREGVIEQVRLRNSRPREINRLLEGRPLTQVLPMVPMIYSLCGVAQTVAALSAAESALGVEVEPEVVTARQLLLQAETARELGLRLSRDWLGEMTEAAPLIRWFNALHQELRWALSLHPQPQNALDSASFSRGLQEILQPLVGTEQRLQGWLSGGLLSGPIKRPLESLQTDLGDIELASAARPLEIDQPDELNWIGSRLSEPQAALFCAQPEIAGACRETSIWTRNRGAELVSQGRAKGLNPLMLRFLAMLAELQALPQQISTLVPKNVLPLDGKGIAAVEAARGLLIHRMVLSGGSVSHCQLKEYKIIAPTEWNFHPRGSLVTLLEGVRVDRDRLHALVEKLILLVDPCVDWEIEIGH